MLTLLLHAMLEAHRAKGGRDCDALAPKALFDSKGTGVDLRCDVCRGIREGTCPPIATQ